MVSKYIFPLLSTNGVCSDPLRSCKTKLKPLSESSFLAISQQSKGKTPRHWTRDSTGRGYFTSGASQEHRSLITFRTLAIRPAPFHSFRDNLLFKLLRTFSLLFTSYASLSTISEIFSKAKEPSGTDKKEEVTSRKFPLLTSITNKQEGVFPLPCYDPI